MCEYNQAKAFEFGHNIVTFLLVVVFLLAVLSGCGSNKTAQAGKAIFSEEDISALSASECTISGAGKSVHLGMTKSELEKAIGSDGELLRSVAYYDDGSFSSSGLPMEFSNESNVKDIIDTYCYSDSIFLVDYARVYEGEETNVPAIGIAVGSSKFTDGHGFGPESNLQDVKKYMIEKYGESNLWRLDGSRVEVLLDTSMQCTKNYSDGFVYGEYYAYDGNTVDYICFHISTFNTLLYCEDDIKAMK